jgi:hypothetical protein
MVTITAMSSMSEGCSQWDTVEGFMKRHLCTPVATLGAGHDSHLILLPPCA